MTGVEIALAVGAAAAAAGAAAEGVAAANQAEFQAEIAEQQAERERQLAARQSQGLRRQQSRLGARSRARRAGSGVVGRGSSLLIEEDIAAETELGALDLLNNGVVSATRLEQQARLERAAGRGKRDRALLLGAAAAASGLR
ncbi:MAG: hypothetical protein QNJ06_11240 [Kiloniellales bacterium]|nr:hypothetical protein [Kiloniellales bacterium]MDJ0981240.1 hypothetical protein [Kiloniellales bacterium]